MEELKQKYDFLTKYVPRTAEFLLAQYTKEVESKREMIIRKHRAISLIPLISTNINMENWIPDKSAFPRFVFMPTEVSPPRVAPQLLQQTAQLYQLIQQNTNDLFEGLCSIKGSPLYYFVIYSSIPSLFGYFSSQEHIQLAFSFYMHVITMDDTKAATEMLFPFYNTPCVYKFIANTMEPFCDRILSDTRLKGKNKFPSKTILEAYVKDFSELITNSAKLLTHCHSVILKLMLQRWGMKATIDFIMNVLIKILTAMWLEGNGYNSKMPFLRIVLNTISSDSKLAASIVQKIIDAETLMELPDMYTAFSHQYILFLSTSQDFSALLKVMLLSKNSIPPSIVNCKSETSIPYSLYWIRIFPKRQLPKHNLYRPLVFTMKKTPEIENPEFDRIWRSIQQKALEEDKEPYEYLTTEHKFKSISDDLLHYTLIKSINFLEEDASQFENLMEFMLNHNELEKWMDIADAHLRMASAPIAALAVQAAYDRQYKYINYAFQKATTLFNSRLTNQSQYLILLQKYLPYFMKHGNVEKQLSEIENWWHNYLDKEIANIDKYRPLLDSNSSNALFWDCVEKIRIVSKDDLMLSFTIIIQVLSTLNEILKSPSFTRTKTAPNDLVELGSIAGKAAILGRADNLFSVYIIIGSLGMDNNTFKNLCLSNEQRMWVALEAQIFTFLECDLHMSEAVSKLQEQLRNIEKDGDDSRF